MNHIRGKSTIIIISSHLPQGVAATSCPRGIMRTRTATFSHPNHWEPPTGVFEQSYPIYLVKAMFGHSNHWEPPKGKSESISQYVVPLTNFTPAMVGNRVSY